MKKIILIILLIVLIIVGYFMLTKGINISIFDIDILSIEQIKSKNENLEKSLQEVSTLTSSDYPQAITELTDSSKKLIIEKEAYANLAATSTSEDVVNASFVEKHNLEHLWVKIGNYATKNGIVLKLEIATGSATGAYNLNFTLNGKYVSISEFIAELEDDSTLEFKIENFKLVPGNVSDSSSDTENLEATFTVKDIAINMEKTDN